MPELQRARQPEGWYDWSRISDDSSMTSAEGDDAEIPVWIGGIEKWVTGLTKRTTCDDVIYALLCHDGNPQGFVDVPSYVICEQWKGVERPLNGRTKIVKHWRTWGSDARNVRLFIRKVESASYPVGSSDTSRSGRSRQRQNGYHDNGYQHSHQIHHQEPKYAHGGRVQGRRSRSVEPRSCRKEVIRDHAGHHEMEHVNQTSFECDPDARALQQLMSVLMDQERKLNDQQSRLKEIDVQIENYENKTHFQRIQKNGQNYVQEAYLRDRSDESSSSGAEDGYVSAKAREMETYLELCHSLVKVEDKITAEHSRIDDLSLMLCEQSVLEVSSGTGRSPRHSSPLKNSTEEYEIDALRRDLHTSLCTGMAQQQELEAASMSLDKWEMQMQEKSVLLNSLLLEVDDLEKTECLSPNGDNESGVCLNGESSSDSSRTVGDHEASFGNHGDNSLTSTPIRYHPQEQKPVQTQLPKPCLPTCNTDPAIFTDLHSSTRSRMESQTSDWDWENELPMAPQKNLAARSMIPYRTYTTYEDSLGLGLANSLKHTALDDSNSDTGLSSLHSDDQPPVLETLV